MFLFKSLNLFEMPINLYLTKNLIINYTFFVNSFMAEVPIIEKLVHSFVEQTNGLVPS